LADRLTRSGRNQVLLIESGPAHHDPLIDMPRGFARTLLQPERTWVYIAERSGGHSEPEYWLRGRGLGGSSAVNGMIYLRGQASDYDDWEAAGCPGWGWNNMHAAFMAMEDQGRITIPSRGGPVTEAMIKSANQLGIPRSDNLNAVAAEEAIGYSPSTIWKGKRQSTANGFLDAARKRPNLRIETHTDALKLIFRGRSAIGVRVRASSGEKDIFARKLVVSAGALNSPKLLQLSGIGEPELLRGLGIQVVASAPAVGRNLREHRPFISQFRLRFGSENDAFRGAALVRNFLRYKLFRSGPLTAAAFEVSALIRTEPGAGRPDAQLGLSPISVDKSLPGFELEKEPGALCCGYVIRPRSKGSIEITSADPDAPPRICPKFLSEEYDRRASVATFRFIRKLFAQPALAPFVISETIPGTEVQTDEEILDAIHRLGGGGYHAVGTCRMGQDTEAVVDPSLRVRGVENLMVADLSVIPLMVSGSTNAPAMATAWRAADIIEQNSNSTQ